MVYFNESFKFENVNDAFDFWYYKLTKDMEKQESRDGDVVGEVINATTIINDPTKNICDGTRDMSMRYAIGEMMWYLSGNNELKAIQNITHAWDRMSDDGKTVNSNYGWCIESKYGFNQWQYVYDLLKENPNTRQAIIHIKTADDEESKDVNCTVCLQFFIRDNKLYLTTYMRSNDLWMGFPYDVFQFTNMQILMAMQLGIEVGTYTHIAGSLHLYERNVSRRLIDESSNMEV